MSKGITVDELNKIIKGLSITDKESERKSFVKIMSSKKEGKGIKRKRGGLDSPFG